MASVQPANAVWCFVLAGLCLFAADLCAQPRNPLRERGGVNAIVSDDDDASRAGYWLVSDEEDPPPLAPARPAPARDFVLPHDQPAIWPDRPFPTQRAHPMPIGGMELPPEESDFGSLDDGLANPRHPRRNHRFTGWGQPLYGTSWLNRPYYLGVYIGQGFLDNPLSDIELNNTGIWGLRLGWDFDYYWALEARYSAGNPDASGSAASSPDASAKFYDLALMWYPTGDSRWRPFLSAAVGGATYSFNRNRVSITDTAFELPLGVGLKYFLTPWSSLRLEFQYAPTFGTERLDSMHSASFGISGEIRFGGARRSYFPWSGDTTYW